MAPLPPGKALSGPQIGFPAPVGRYRLAMNPAPGGF